MTKKFIKDALVWGIILWLIGYALGIIFFAFVSNNILGWVIMPIGLLITLFVLWKKVNGITLKYYFGLGIVWAVIAIVFDYFFLVKLFHPADGYYKLDVYLYYILTFVMPVAVGWKKTNTK